MGFPKGIIPFGRQRLFVRLNLSPLPHLSKDFYLAMGFLVQKEIILL